MRIVNDATRWSTTVVINYTPRVANYSPIFINYDPRKPLYWLHLQSSLTIFIYDHKTFKVQATDQVKLLTLCVTLAISLLNTFFQLH